MEKYARKGVILDERVNMLEQKHGNSDIKRKVCVSMRACVRACMRMRWASPAFIVFTSPDLSGGW